MASFNYQSDPTFQFLLFLIRKYINRHKRDYIELFDEKKVDQVDFDHLFKLITYHKVELIVLPILKELNLPKFDSSKLAIRAKDIVQKQLLMEKQLTNIISKFDENGIDSVILKGAPLDRKLYGNQTKRVYKDIDILINHNKLNNAGEALLNLGFKIKKNSRYNLDFLEQYPLAKKGLKDITYMHKKSKLILELHWRISTINDLDVTLNDDFFKRVRYGVQDYSVLKNEYELLYLIYHGAMSGWHRLKWLIDIVDYLDTVDIDRAFFEKLVIRTKCQKFIKDLQEVAKQYFQIELLLPDVADYKIFKSFRHKYIFDKNYFSDLSVKQLTIRDLLYRFFVSPNKFKYLQTYAIGYFYKRKAIKLQPVNSN